MNATPKLLFDENLSPRLVSLLTDVFPGSVHVRDVGLKSATDTTVWKYAAAHGFMIISKDADFRQRSLLFGHPPKTIGLLLGNCPTNRIETVIRTSATTIGEFALDTAAAFLGLP